MQIAVVSAKSEPAIVEAIHIVPHYTPLSIGNLARFAGGRLEVSVGFPFGIVQIGKSGYKAERSRQVVSDGVEHHYRCIGGIVDLQHVVGLSGA